MEKVVELGSEGGFVCEDVSGLQPTEALWLHERVGGGVRRCASRRCSKVNWSHFDRVVPLALRVGWRGSLGASVGLRQRPRQVRGGCRPGDLPGTAAAGLPSGSPSAVVSKGTAAIHWRDLLDVSPGPGPQFSHWTPVPPRSRTSLCHQKVGWYALAKDP